MEPRTRHDHHQYRREVHAADLYDPAFGPSPPRVYRSVPGEWDDPTWIAVEVNDEWMAEQAIRDQRVLAEQAVRDRWELRHEREELFFENSGHARPRNRPKDSTIDAVLVALATAPATAGDIQVITGLTPPRVIGALNWLRLLGDVHVDQYPGPRRWTYYRLARPWADAAWKAIKDAGRAWEAAQSRAAQTKAETDRRNQEAALRAGLVYPPWSPGNPARRFHWPLDEIRAACGRRGLLDRRAGLPAWAVPVGMRCQSRACRERYEGLAGLLRNGAGGP